MIFNEEIIGKAMSYEGFLQLTEDLLADNKTTGDNHSEAMIQYTRQNMVRIRRIEKTLTIKPALESMLKDIREPQVWLVLAEAWCGDVANNLPVLARMARLSPVVKLGILLRDEHPEIMDAYLTDGGRSIPKLISLDAETLAEKFSWGPRPAPAQEMIRAYKKNPDKPYQEFAKEVQLWYVKDKYQQIQEEFIEILKKEVSAQA